MKTFRTIANRDEGWWILQCVEEPGAMSQLRSLSEANDHKEAISHLTGISEDEIELEVIVEPGSKEDTEKIRRYVELSNQIMKIEKEYALLQIELAEKLVKKYKFSYRDIGVILRLSHQRIGQLVAQMKH